MIRHEIPVVDWATKLARAIRERSDGDTVVVHTEAMQELGERTLQRLGLTGKKITFELKER